MESALLERIQKLYQKFRYVLIYGAGGVTEDLLILMNPYLYRERTYIVVSDKSKNKSQIGAYPVKEISAFLGIQDTVFIIISVMPRNALSIENDLKESGFENYCFVSQIIDALYHEIWTNKMAKNKVVLANGDGYGFGGNPKYIALELLRRRQDLDLVWIARDTNTILPQGVRAVQLGTYEHYYELGTAKIWIDNQHKSFYVRKRDGQIYMQTWHGGGPLKKIEFDAEGLSQSYLDLCEINSQMEDIMISPTGFNSQLYRKAFHYTGEIMECGYPRNDLFWKANKCRERIEKMFGVSKQEGIVLFAPTYKDCSATMENELDLGKVEEALTHRFQKKFRIFVRFHPFDKEPEKKYKWCGEWSNVTAYDDVQELLAASDILITDYSSIMWDFSLQKKPVFLFHPDLQQYQTARGYYLSFDKMPYIEAFSNVELYQKIIEFDSDIYRSKLLQFLSEYQTFDTGIASETVVERILGMM